MNQDIVEKLNKHIKNTGCNFEEKDVVYIMVELRKLLDLDLDGAKEADFPLVRFHSDWIVHTSKDRHTHIMNKILSKIEKSLDPYPENGDTKFLLFPEFKSDMEKLFRLYNLPTTIFEHETWKIFIQNMTSALSDQPLFMESGNIESLTYLNVPTAIAVDIVFRGPKLGNSIFIYADLDSL